MNGHVSGSALASIHSPASQRHLGRLGYVEPRLHPNLQPAPASAPVATPWEDLPAGPRYQTVWPGRRPFVRPVALEVHLGAGLLWYGLQGHGSALSEDRGHQDCLGLV